MALTFEVIPPSMTIDGHTKDEDYECATVTKREDFWFLISAEQRKLSDYAEAVFTEWVFSQEVARMVSEFCEVPTGYGSVSFTIPDANNRGYTYQITGTRLKKHTAITRYM